MAVVPCIVCLRIAPVRRGRFSAHRNSKPNKSCIMKKIFTLLAFAACCAAAAWSCSDEYDDSRTPSGDRGHQTGDRLDEGAGEFVEDARRRLERQQVHYELYGVGRRLVDYVQRRQDHHDPRRRERRRRSCAGYRQVRGCLLLDAGRAPTSGCWTMPAARFRWRGRTAKPLRSTRRAIGRSTASRSKVPTGQPVKAVGEDGDSFFEDVRRPTTR